jgi:hypothetical protein
MVADGGVGIYFNGCELENVTVSGLRYGITSEPPRSDLEYVSKFHRVTLDSISAIYFRNCISAKNVLFRDMVTAKGMDYAFGGDSEIEVKAENLLCLDEKTKLSSKAKITLA